MNVPGNYRGFSAENRQLPWLISDVKEDCDQDRDNFQASDLEPPGTG